MSRTTPPGPINGVDIPTLFATIDAVAGTRELAKFRFRATNTWEAGTYSRTSIRSFYGAGREHAHVREFVIDADHPRVLVGEDRGALPVELVLAGLVSSLTGQIGHIASERGIELWSVEATIEGDMDLQGSFGLSDDVRPGFEQIRVDFRIEGDAPRRELEAIVERATRRSAVYDVFTNGVPIHVTVG